VIFIRFDDNSEIIEENYANYYTKYIVENEERNQFFAEITKMFLEKNKKILIITRRVDHIKIMHDLIGIGFCIHGSTQKDERKKMFKEFKEADKGLLIGTSSIFSTGINLPNLDCIVNVTGGKSDIEVIQVIGRILRTAKNKKCGYYIDLLDNNQEFFEEAALARIEILTKSEFDVEVIKDPKDIEIA
jgi:superfamily II DNA or RNA helicase